MSSSLSLSSVIAAVAVDVAVDAVVVVVVLVIVHVTVLVPAPLLGKPGVGHGPVSVLVCPVSLVVVDDVDVRGGDGRGVVDVVMFNIRVHTARVKVASDNYVRGRRVTGCTSCRDWRSHGALQIKIKINSPFLWL